MPFTSPSWLQKFAQGAVDLLFPASCLACNVELSDQPHPANFCRDCQGELLRGDWPVCQRCASRVPKIPGTVSTCGHCRDQKLWFERTLALGDYDGLLRDQVLAMKTDRSERLGHALAQLMAMRWRDALLDLDPDGIVPVPMNAWRRLARGTNPPAALAATLGHELGLPVYARLLERRRNSQPQIGLSHPARIRNVRGQMQARASYLIEGAHVLLVDDTLTTGATCNEAARTLKRAGAASVTVLVAARTASY